MFDPPIFQKRLQRARNVFPPAIGVQREKLIRGLELSPSQELLERVRTLIFSAKEINYSVTGIVSVPGNPRVNNCYPYPYPSKPLPSLRGKGYRLGG